MVDSNSLYQNMQKDLEIDLLRAFVAVATYESFTKAATLMCRTQSAISMQIKKLEGIVGLQLFFRTRKSVKITSDGETLLIYANRIIRLNDETISRLNEPETDGVVRIGAPDDYATHLLPPVLSSFSKNHPLVSVEVHCDNGADLLVLLDKGKLDLVIATHSLTNLSGEVLRKESLHWVASPEFYIDEMEPLPLILFPPGCVCREVAFRALEQMGRPWRITYSTHSIALIHSALTSKSGVTVMEASIIPEGYKILDGKAGLPILPEVAMALHRYPGQLSPATQLACTHFSHELKSPKLNSN